MHSRSAAGVGLALLAAVTFATSGTFARSLIEAGWSAESAVIARVGVAALVLAIPALLSLRGKWDVLRSNATAIGLFGLLGVGLAQVCYFNAVRYLPVGVALLLEYLGIILVVAWMWLRHRQPPRRLTIAGSVAALAGLAFVLDLAGTADFHPVGVLWGLGAAFGLAGYFVLAGRVDPRLPSVAMASGGMAVGAAMLLLIGLTGLLPLHATFGEVTFAGQPTSWLVPIAGLSLVAAVIAYLAGIAGTRILGPRLSSFLGLTEVLFAVLIAWLFLNELPTGWQLFGGALIVAGVALVRLDELRGSPSTPAPATPEPELALDGR